MKAAQTGPNQQMLQMMLSKNSDFANAYNDIQKNGGDGEKVFMDRAKQLGMSDEQISSFLNEAKQAYAQYF